MAVDFRTLLKEKERVDAEERWFEDIPVGELFLLSAQASPSHECTPQEMLDDPMEYEAFHVFLTASKGVISYGRSGAWESLNTKPWAKYFNSDTPHILIGENVPVASVQQAYEDLLAWQPEL